MKKPNAGMVVSSVAHAAVLAYAVIGFTNAKTFEPSPEALPVEVLTLSEFDELTKGSNISKEIADAPKVKAKEVAAVTPKPLPPAPDAKEDVAAPPPEPEAAEPPAEPQEPEPKQADTPPPEPEPEVKPEPEPKKAAETPPAVPQPKPVNLPKPEKKVVKNVEKKPEKPKPSFDPSKIASLIDRRDPGLKPQEAPEISNVTTAGISSGAAPQLSLSMQSMIANMIRQQIESRGCFNPPPGTIGRTDLYATVAFEVTPDGILIGHPQLHGGLNDPLYPAFADSAVRAVYNCASTARPLQLPPEHYDFWKSIVLNVRPPLG